MARTKTLPTPPEPGTLTPFDGREVVGTSIKITNAGDGLSKALGVDPAEYHTGEKVYVVLETEVGPITHKPVEDTGQFIRVHTLVAGTGTIVAKELVSEVIDAQRKKIEEAEGIQRLDFDGDPDADVDED